MDLHVERPRTKNFVNLNEEKNTIEKYIDTQVLYFNVVL